jgi:hypothetical protein
MAGILTREESSMKAGGEQPNRQSSSCNKRAAFFRSGESVAIAQNLLMRLANTPGSRIFNLFVTCA